MNKLQNNVIPNEKINKYIEDEQNIINSSHGWNETIENWKNETNNKLKKLQKRGFKIAGKAFPARASIIINLLGINENTISVIFEKYGSKK